uniref:Uncharacterized protein n=1 Tax=Piliocolobus tephrosceles TaxID=591936 RepID=A0A8C9LQU3_9PRIM
MLSDVCIKCLPTTATVLRFLSSFVGKDYKNIFIGITELCTSHKRRTKPVVYTGQGERRVYLPLHICHVSVSIHSSRPGPWRLLTPAHLLLRTASIRPPR